MNLKETFIKIFPKFQTERNKKNWLKLWDVQRELYQNI